MMRVFIFGISLLTCLLLIGCGTSNPTLATIGDGKITLHEFEDSFAKYNGGWDTSATLSLASREQFLDLLIKFNMKVKDARAQGLEKDTAIVDEINTYGNLIGQSYMIDKDLVEPGIEQLYQRRNEDVHACHILLRIPQNAKPADTLAVYERAMKIIAQLQDVRFDTLAHRYSEDPSVKNNHGDLGFFSGGRMAPEFEDACYSLKPGQNVKLPVRTNYGYHIIKLLERRPNRGSIKLSHILFLFNEARTDTAVIKDSVWTIYEQIKKGGSFAELAKKYSRDLASAPKGGDIGFYDFNRIPLFAADILCTMPVDSVAKPIRFNYGYHIFKVMEKKGIASFEEMHNDLKNQYQQTRHKYEFKKYTDQLRKQYKVTIDSAVVKTLISSIDSIKQATDEHWKDTISAKLLSTPIVISMDNPLTVNDFADRVIRTEENKKYKLTPPSVWQLVEKAAETVSLERHAEQAMVRFPELALRMKEYEEGVLIYRIEQDEVMKKVMVNDSLLKEYYNIHKENYRWPERVNFAEIYILKDSVAKAVYKKLRRGKNFMDIAEEYTNRPGYKEKKGEWGLQPFAINELTRKASTMAIDSICAPFKYEMGWSIIKTLAIDGAHVKTFEEATSEVAGAYQEIATKKREKEWIESLYTKYPVKIDKEVMAKAFKRKRS